MPAVTVIIPLYNKGPYIRRALDSVMTQTVRSFEIIVIDGGSTDRGAEVVRTFKDARIRFLRQEGHGVSGARNQGFLAGKSDFIAFLDADDEWLPDHLETLLRLRESYPEAGAYATGYAMRGMDGAMKRPNLKRVPAPPWEGLFPSYFIVSARSDQAVWTSAVGVPKHVLMEVGGFPSDVAVGEDLITWFNIALRYPIAYTQTVSAIYHREAMNRTAELARSSRWEERVVDVARQAIGKGEVPPGVIHEIEEFIAGYQIALACKDIADKDVCTARKILIECKTRLFFWERLMYLGLVSLPLPVLSWVLSRSHSQRTEW